MNMTIGTKRKKCGIAALALGMFLFCACSPIPSAPSYSLGQEDTGISGYLVAVEDEPDTVDFQCTSIHYTIAQNVFDRLVEMENDENGNSVITPSLAESWEVSDDGRTYTFHLRDSIRFSNQSPLTASDVRYTFTRLLTHPDSCNTDIADNIEGAAELKKGEAAELSGLKVLNDLDFTITLQQPFEAFLACLSMPGASILDEETTAPAGEKFGIDPASTIGTGPYIFEAWEADRILLKANPDCWSGAPLNEGVCLRFLTEAEEERILFEQKELNILDLDELGDAAEYFIHGDIYQDHLYEVQPIGITYIALNESKAPLNDGRIRKALQLALNRQILLDAVHSGRGDLENGIFPHGLRGFNPDLEEIPYDPEAAEALLAEAGYPGGFPLTVTVKSSAAPWELTLMRMAASMWEKAGIHTTLEVVEESDFMTRRKSGQLMCYAATWTADYNDPDNFIYTFFGSRENTAFRSLCYPDQAVMFRVREARAISDPDERLEEYQELERIIVQEDAAWIPLFSRHRYYVTSEDTSGFRSSWNGSVKANYRYMSIDGREDS